MLTLVIGAGNIVTTVLPATPRTAPALPSSWWVLIRRALGWLLGREEA